MNSQTLKTLALTLVVSLFTPPVWADTAEQETPPTLSAFDPQPAPAAPALEILSAEDIALYQEIFDLQEDGRWKKADRRIKKLDSDILMGHVKFQRYMHPTKYRSKYKELRDWMAVYNDHPEAYRIYRLANKRRPANYRAPKAPAPRNYKGPATTPSTATALPPKTKAEKNRDRAEYRARSKISRYLVRGQIARAEKRLWGSETAGIFDELAFDTQMSRIASAYYYAGELERAEVLGSIAAERSIDQLPEASWIAGLAAWKLGHWSQAAGYFEAVWVSPESNSWLRAAGAFWSARAHMKARQPKQANAMLRKAAAEQRTFYGLLAQRQLGEPNTFNWDLPVENATGAKLAMDTAGLRRAIALKQVGMPEAADREFLMAHRRLPPGNDLELLPVAMNMGLHGSVAKLSRRIINNHDQAIDSALYPMPDWVPADGFKLDKALLMAVMRQESAFNAYAVSYAGASGLMQLMPATAAYIERDNSLRRKNHRKLFDPSFNMKLGQKYLNYLMRHKMTDGNLMLVIAAYNAGPGNIAKWKLRTGHGDDWLLFMESIPNRQNRNYVERVLANLWIYRLRFGQEAPTLDQVAQGALPRYASLDPAFAPAKPKQTAGLNTQPAEPQDAAAP